MNLSPTTAALALLALHDELKRSQDRPGAGPVTLDMLEAAIEELAAHLSGERELRVAA